MGYQSPIVYGYGTGMPESHGGDLGQDKPVLASQCNQPGVSSVKIIRNKQTGQSEGYGLVEFYSRATAEKILQSYGDLAADVTDSILHETFCSRFQSVKGAKVVIDSNTGRSKGYGFVRFGDENERSRAMTEMNGVYCSNRPMRIGVATPKKASGHQQQYSSQGCGAPAAGHVAPTGQARPIFVGGLDSDVSDDDLREPFSQFGEIISVKIPPGKGCGFVQFANSLLLETGFSSGMEDIIEGKAMVVMATAMLQHQIRIQTRIVWPLLLVLLKRGASQS
ncbi:hypothetical protein J1N35_024612 [Gossypium stocksii]|uniref:RRM domain-containing protein n=1 Tax=Gossypium stocksii TaxID=47602 RepID=A0A9D3V515_9ROSI|nr:hypothetical protein J1N35_024612 [Gossypium stocksii]